MTDERVIHEQVNRIANAYDTNQNLAAWLTVGASIAAYHRELTTGGVSEFTAHAAVLECTRWFMRKILWADVPPCDAHMQDEA